MKGSLAFQARQFGVYYLLFTLIGVIGGSIAWQYRLKVKEEEKIDLLIVTEEDNAWQQEFSKHLNDNEPEGIIEINTRYILPSSRDLPTLFSTFGAVEADVFFAPKETWESSWIDWSIFLPLDPNKVEKTFGENLTYWEHDNRKMGFSFSSSLLPKGEEWFCVVAASSCHLGDWEANTYDDAALRLLKGICA